MIDKKIGDKPIHFEVSIGNAGNVMDGYNAPCRNSREDNSSDSDAGSDREDDKLTASLDAPQYVYLIHLIYLLSVSPTLCLSVSVSLSESLSVCLSVCLCVCVYVCLCVCVSALI